MNPRPVSWLRASLAVMALCAARFAAAGDLAPSELNAAPVQGHALVLRQQGSGNSAAIEQAGQ
ncbi:hypothetical protein [Massilia antarctica]|nr:hypothetical protein [Massilia sp. H27-R4]MCY0913407.1 hypothetical protein [Massilia sp. H27-R4]CUI09539.1 hypothetical protein BN2497_13855 [Janthinobacterium sp. CG23_2]CUU33325.1 hypothetical protein BN3177_13855 [Janthinobacterium sp. CG23_2]